ncbi:MAG: Asp23/Gls24 family envelope stress response protein [Solirubrobacteraceae bacterium]
MEEQRTETGSDPAVARRGDAGSDAAIARRSDTAVARRGGATPLDTERGKTTIADGVVTKVAAIAAREVPGVHALGGGAARTLGAMGQRVGISDERTQGVSVETGESEAAVDLTVVVEYGESIPQVAGLLRDNISKRIEGMTGLRVTEVNVTVNDLHFPGDDEEQQEEPRRVE